ncbi:hypothetical protein LJB81_02340 [Desulfovibrio sp. OttesenSCG-928-M14]|nr:hypothetical protein [Desulfovibrio sp. OttesenSCG-928-M14]
MTPEPALKISEIIALVNKLVKIEPAPSEFELAKLDSQLRSIIDHDPVGYHSFRGVFFTLSGDYESALRHHDIALQFVPVVPDAYHIYAVSLSKMGRHRDAMHMEEKAIETGGPDIHALSGLIHNAYFANEMQVLDEWLPKFEALTGAPHEVSDWLAEDAEDIADLPAILAEAEKEGCISLYELKKELGL